MQGGNCRGRIPVITDQQTHGSIRLLNIAVSDNAVNRI